MKIFSYIQYFFYIGLNWNWRIAFHILKNEIKGEKKYGVNTIGIDELGEIKKDSTELSHATIYMPVSYDLLEEAFIHLPLHPPSHFLDIGCGRGRVLSVAAQHNCKKITGIDFSKKLCKEAEENMLLLKQQFQGVDFTVINTNAKDFIIPSNIDCVFMFNPFDAFIMKGVVNNIIKSIQQNPRKIFIIYVNPLHKDLFIEKAFTEIYYSKRLQYLEVSILTNAG